ncbi:MAG: hypothetical protein ACYC8T_01105 [Myxococcaceae bacterium]
MNPLCTALVLLLGAAEPAPATIPAVVESPLEVRHLPLAQGPVGEDLTLHATVRQAYKLAHLTAHYRTAGEQSYRQAPFEKSADGDFAAVIPGSAVQRPAVEYYVASRDRDGKQVERFASAGAPHPVVVQADPQTLHRDALVELYGRRRSKATVSGEFVNYGNRSTRGGTVYPDWYYRAEGDYLYRALTPLGEHFRIDSIRIGVGTMRSNNPPLQALISAPLVENAKVVKSGIDYGFTEVETSFAPVFGMSAKLLLGGNAEGFSTGFGMHARFGRPRGARVELGGETIAGIGSTADFKLAWDTVPRVPMSATLAITDVPSVTLRDATTGPVGVRITYRADWEVTDAVILGAHLGYQARAAVGGGLSFGLSTSLAW